MYWQGRLIVVFVSEVVYLKNHSNLSFNSVVERKCLDEEALTPRRKLIVGTVIAMYWQGRLAVFTVLGNFDLTDGTAFCLRSIRWRTKCLLSEEPMTIGAALRVVKVRLMYSQAKLIVFSVIDGPVLI